MSMPGGIPLLPSTHFFLITHELFETLMTVTHGMTCHKATNSVCKRNHRTNFLSKATHFLQSMLAPLPEVHKLANGRREREQAGRVEMHAINTRMFFLYSCVEQWIQNTGSNRLKSLNGGKL